MVRSLQSFRPRALEVPLRPRTWFAAVLAASVAATGACTDDASTDAQGKTQQTAGDVDAAPPNADVTDAGASEDAAIAQDDGGEVDAVDAADAHASFDPIFETTKVGFTATVGTGQGVCYDIDTTAEVDCVAGDGTWDLMFEVDAAKHAYNLWTSGGVKGKGKGASFGPVPQATADAMVSAKDVPGWFADYFGGTFAEHPWYAYDLMGTHDVTANGRVYVVDTGTNKFKVQLTSYYGPGGASGLVTLRYGKLTEPTFDEIVLDATAGGFGAPVDSPANKAAYFDLDAKAVVAIDDAQAKANTAWDLAIKRYNVTLNGGASGPGAVTAAIADARDALYDAAGAPIKAKFQAITAADMQAAFDAQGDAAGLTFKADDAKPYILNDGSAKSWFGVKPPPPVPPEFFARPENWWVIRSAGGDSYARVHVTSVVASTRTFTIELFIQPKAK